MCRRQAHHFHSLPSVTRNRQKIQLTSPPRYRRGLETARFFSNTSSFHIFITIISVTSSAGTFLSSSSYFIFQFCTLKQICRPLSERQRSITNNAIDTITIRKHLWETFLPVFGTVHTQRNRSSMHHLHTFPTIDRRLDTFGVIHLGDKLVQFVLQLCC